MQDFLDALRHIPQEHILGMVDQPADHFMLDLIPSGIAITERDQVFYNKDGVIDEMPGAYILFALAPMYGYDGDYRGTGYDTIFLFYEIG